jgi:hypothetical protein
MNLRRPVKYVCESSYWGQVTAVWAQEETAAAHRAGHHLHVLRIHRIVRRANHQRRDGNLAEVSRASPHFSSMPLAPISLGPGIGT